MVSHGYPPRETAGTERHVEAIANALGRRGHAVHVAAATRAPGRRQYARLTEAGAALYADAIPAWRRAQDRAAELLGEGGAEALAELADVRLPEP